MAIKYVFGSSKKTKVLYPKNDVYLKFEYDPNYPDYYVYITDDEKIGDFLDKHESDIVLYTNTNPKNKKKMGKVKSFKWLNKETYETQKKLEEAEAKLLAKTKEAEALKEVATKELKSEGLSDEEVEEKLENVARDKEISDLKELLKSEKYQEVADAHDIKIKLNFGLDKLNQVKEKIESYFED